LFTGPKGIGKTSVARILAHMVNNLPYNDESVHLDIIEIDAASNRRIDDIRDLREKVHIAPVEAPYKVYIIDEVHMLTGESFNALLKTLEEPPSHVIFILATTEAHKLPATIISRTQRFHFRPAAAGSVAKHLSFIAKSEGITIEPEALELLAKHGEGSFRDSISLLDQLSALTGGNIRLNVAEQVIGVSPHAAIEAIIKHLNNGDTAALQKILSEQLEERGINAHIITSQLIKALKLAAHDNSNFYTLIDNLLEVPKSSQPSLKLAVLLLKFASATEKEDPAKTTKAANVNKPALPAVSKTPQQVVSNQSSVDSKKQNEDNKTQATDNRQQKTDDRQPFELSAWQEVLNTVKKSNPPLYSVLAKGEPRLKDDELTLAFGYKLHQKKLDDPKFRTKLTKTVNDLGYDCPKISAIVDRASVAPNKTARTVTPEAADETTKDVIGIMGGGEVVNA
jgi:DNA polymerase-3 subunit gamma/tau